MNERLRQLRAERGLTLKEVATQLGMPLSTYSNYEQGIREPSLAVFKQICDFFDVSADYLLGRTSFQ